MKNRIMCLSVCVVFIWDAGAGAVTPLVELLFDDASSSSTENLGSLGGTQYLLSTGVKAQCDGTPATCTVLDTAFDSGKQWRVTSWVDEDPNATYLLPELSEVTVAFWVRRAVADYSASNIFTLKNDDGIQFGAYWWHEYEIPAPPHPDEYDVHLISPGLFSELGDDTLIPNVLPLDNWTHVAITYAATGGNLYIDGVLEVAIDPDPYWTGPIPAGCRAHLSDTSMFTQLINGMDNFFIFDSVLTQSQVQNLMSTNRVPTIATTCGEVDDYFISVADLNTDCYVDLLDFAVFANIWLQCVQPGDPLCNEPWL